jgi:hypothetical protein
MRKTRKAYIILEGKPHGKQLLGRPLIMSESTIKLDIREMVLQTGAG